MASMLPPDLDNDSMASSPRTSEYDPQPRVRLMCTFGGKILPRPHDNQLSYVGGDNRIVAVHRHSSFASLLHKLSKLSGTSNISVKYQLPNEDLDALISVSTDEDVENMMDEYDRIALNQNPRSPRLRLFLFTTGGDGCGDNDSRASSISSLLDSSVNREQWFLDALNSGTAGGIERGRSEVSSLVSEVPDYLFGLDNPEETSQPRESRTPKPRIRREVSAVSEPGSPAPGVSSPFGSTSSAPALRFPTQERPAVQAKPENQDPIPNQEETPLEPVIQQTGHLGNSAWQYSSPHVQYPGHAVPQYPVYYVPGSVHPGHGPVQHVPAAAAATPQFLPQYHQVQTGHHQAPMGYQYHQPHSIPGSGQVYHGAAQPVMVAADGVNRGAYYGMKNPGPVHVYHPGMMVPGMDEQYRTEPNSDLGRAS